MKISMILPLRLEARPVYRAEAAITLQGALPSEQYFGFTTIEETRNSQAG